jgi:hypothetical protein
MFSPDSRKPIVAFAIALVLVGSVAVLARAAFAGEAPDPITQQLEDQIKDRQPKVTAVKNKIAAEEARHKEEMDKLNAELDGYKNSNAFDVGRMNERGWTFDWSKNDAVKLEGPLTQRP